MGNCFLRGLSYFYWVKEQDEKLLADLTDLYEAGAKTICINRDQAKLFMGLLMKRESIIKGAQLASKYLNKQNNADNSKTIED